MHLFSPSNPMLDIETGLVYYVGRGGMCTQLSPIPAGFGTSTQNPSTYTGGPSPGQPNWGVPGSGPFSPPFAPFPQGPQSPAIVTFNISTHYNSAGFGWNYSDGILVSPARGSLNSGGGRGGIVLSYFAVASNGAVNISAWALKSQFASNPIQKSNLWTKMTWAGTNPTVQSVLSASASYNSSSTTSRWAGTWNYGSGGGDINSGSDATFTVTVT
jgi:hypothetical protein